MKIKVGDKFTAKSTIEDNGLIRVSTGEEIKVLETKNNEIKILNLSLENKNSWCWINSQELRNII